MRASSGLNEIMIADIQHSEGTTLRERYEQLSKTAKIFVIIIFLQSCTIIALTIQRMTHPLTTYSEYYSILTLINSVFLAVFAVDSVMNENGFELVGFVIVSVIVTVIIISQFILYLIHGEKDSNTEKGVLWARFLSVIIFTPINVILSVIVYKSFGWFLYRKIGASPELQDVYRKYQIFTSLLKIDLQFSINLVIIAGFFMVEGWELYLDIAALIFTLVWAFLGWAGVRRENQKAVALFFVTSVIQPAFLSYQFFDFLMDSHSSTTAVFLPLIYVAGVVSLLTRAALLISTVLCYRNFDHGLKDVFLSEKDRLSEVSKLLPDQ